MLYVIPIRPLAKNVSKDTEMNIQEKRKAFEKLLAGAPEVMSPLQVSKWTPYGRNTVYAMLRSGELPPIQYAHHIRQVVLQRNHSFFQAYITSYSFLFIDEIIISHFRK